MSHLKHDLAVAKAMINTPEKWAENGSQRYAAGKHKMCAVDAISNARLIGGIEPVRQALIAQIPNHSYSLLALYNDDPTTTHADIMALFDRAIAAAP